MPRACQLRGWPADPEDLREVISGYHSSVAEIVAGFDGFAARYMGDAIVVYFGYPQAYEDDAEPSVRARLGVIGSVGRLVAKSVAGPGPGLRLSLVASTRLRAG